MAELFVIPTFIVATLSLLTAVWAIGKIKEVHVLVNSRLTQLLDVVGNQREAEGAEKERVKNEEKRK